MPRIIKRATEFSKTISESIRYSFFKKLGLRRGRLYDCLVVSGGV